MPSEPAFAAVDWEDVGSPPPVSRRTLVVAAGFLAVVAAFVYHHWWLSPTAHLLFDWTPSRLDWLLLAAGWLFVSAVLVPTLRNPAITSDVWEYARRRPATAFAIVWLAAFALVALVGPSLVGRAHINPRIRMQPPLFVTVPEDSLIECVGPVSNGLCHGTLQYPLGTNVSGSNVVTLLVLGARVAFEVAFVAGMLMLPLAVAVGSLAGHYGGWVDTVLMRYVDVQETLPAFLVYLIAAFLTKESLFLIVVVFGFFSWGPVARVVRNAVRQRSDTTYVQAANAAGASRLYVLRRHLLPNVSHVAVAGVSRQLPMLVLAEVSLSFLELNNPVLPSWGQTIAVGLNGYWAPFHVRWWAATITAVVLAATVVSLSVLGNALQDVLDPRQ